MRPPRTVRKGLEVDDVGEGGARERLRVHQHKVDVGSSGRDLRGKGVCRRRDHRVDEDATTRASYKSTWAAHATWARRNLHHSLSRLGYIERVAPAVAPKDRRLSRDAEIAPEIGPMRGDGPAVVSEY